MAQVTENEFHADNYLFVYKNNKGAFVAIVLYDPKAEYSNEFVFKQKPVVEGYTLESVVMEAHRWCKDNPPVEYGVIVDESLL